MYLILIITLLFATPAFAQDISKDAISERIQKLEQEKDRLEDVYRELAVRIDELKQLIAPKDETKDKSKEDK